MNNTNGKLYETFSGPERLTLVLEALARRDEGEADRLSGSCPRKTYTMRDAAYGDRLDTAFDIMAIACIDLRCLWGKLRTLEWATGGARLMATHHQITATFALLDGERLGKGLPQMGFFGSRRESPLEDLEDEETADGEEEPDEPAKPPEPLRASAYREGELASRMSAVEDRMQVMTDYTFASLLATAQELAGELASVWAGFDGFCQSRLGVPATTLLEAWDFPTGNEVVDMLRRYGQVKPDPAKVDEYCGIYCRAWDQRFGGEE